LFFIVQRCLHVLLRNGESLLGSNRLRQMCFRRIGLCMGIRARLGEKLWLEFMRDVGIAAKEMWHPTFASDSIVCAGVLDGPSCPIQAAGIELRLDEIDVDHL
jgi:hypothetical protein